jgi:hypothetical protein
MTAYSARMAEFRRQKKAEGFTESNIWLSPQDKLSSWSVKSQRPVCRGTKSFAWLCGRHSARNTQRNSDKAKGLQGANPEGLEENM